MQNFQLKGVLFKNGSMNSEQQLAQDPSGIDPIYLNETDNNQSGTNFADLINEMKQSQDQYMPKQVNIFNPNQADGPEEEEEEK